MQLPDVGSELGTSCGNVQRPCAAHLGVVVALSREGMMLAQGRCGRWLLDRWMLL